MTSPTPPLLNDPIDDLHRLFVSELFSESLLILGHELLSDLLLLILPNHLLLLYIHPLHWRLRIIQKLASLLITLSFQLVQLTHPALLVVSVALLGSLVQGPSLLDSLSVGLITDTVYWLVSTVVSIHFPVEAVRVPGRQTPQTHDTLVFCLLHLELVVPLWLVPFLLFALSAAVVAKTQVTYFCLLLIVRGVTVDDLHLVLLEIPLGLLS